jgi:uncharacterized protein (DUF1330 family)
MPAYFIAEVEVSDPEGFKAYASQVAATAEQYGGRYIARGGTIHPIEGEAPKRLVISVWDTVEDAKRWHRSPEYSKIIGIRHRTAKTRAFIVEGLPATATT